MNIRKLLSPLSTALIVIDKQSGYFDPQLVKKRFQDLPDNSAEILESIDNFIEYSRKLGIEVIWTQMVENADESPAPIAELMKSDPEGILTVTKTNDPSFEIYGRSKPKPSEKVIKKYRYNAFSQTELSKYLKGRRIKTVILVGGYASRCVLSSVVGANGEDLFCIIPEGLVLNQREAEHEVKIFYDIVNAIFGATLSVEEIISALEDS